MGLVRTCMGTLTREGGSKAAGRLIGAVDRTCMGTSLEQALHGRYAWGAGLTRGIASAVGPVHA